MMLLIDNTEYEVAGRVREKKAEVWSAEVKMP